MCDRFFSDLELALCSYSLPSSAHYDYEDDDDDDDEDMEGDYEVEEVNGGAIEGKSEELACPFCLEDFDVLGFCCHVDADHRMEVRPGICPVCTTKVGMNMASHMITQHESTLKALCNKKHCGSRSRSAILLLRKELQEKHLQCIKESQSANSSSSADADSMFLSFLNNPRHSYRKPPESIKATEEGSTETSSEYETSERIPPSLATDGTDERSRCEFLQGLVLSTMFDDF